ncbi:MAG: hypothetical protein HY361_02940 [Candidatus Aenigmarchaeota archaeon]|nr:hypothetical protein [Candidatus Aenigmarchaeota archaeon]
MADKKEEYILGVSTGMWGIAHDPSIGLGFGSKIQQITTYGVRFVMVNMETSTSTEFFDPELVAKLKISIDNLNIDWGIHGEIGEHVALENALEIRWKQSHRRLHQYLDYLYEFFVKNKEMGKKYLPKFVNIHISNSAALAFIVERFRVTRQFTLDFKGRFDWTTLLGEVPELKKWFKENLIGGLEIARTGLPSLGMEAQQYYMSPFFQEFIEKLSQRRGTRRFSLETGRFEQLPPEEQRRFAEQEEAIRRQEEFAKQRLEELKKMTPDEWITLADRLSPEEKELLIEYLYNFWMAFGAGEYGRGVMQNEDIAYMVVAKYLEFKKDDPKEPVWKIFFGNKSMADLEKEWGRSLIDPKTKYIFMHPDIVAAVGIRYIIGHFETPVGNIIIPEYLSETAKRLNIPIDKFEQFYKKNAFEKIEELKDVFFAFENPEPMEPGMEGLQRIIRAKDMYNFIQAIHKVRPQSKDYIKLVVDFNHWLSNAIDPVKELETVPKDFGTHVYVTHIYYPYPLHSHEAFDIGSDAQRILYNYHFKLKEKGFKFGYLVFERGGGKSPQEIMKSSMIALRMVVDELLKNTSPDKLPLSFYGVSPEGFYSEERQMAVVMDHIRDPLKGLIMVPEETFRFIPGKAIEKGKKPEETAKEEFR